MVVITNISQSNLRLLNLAIAFYKSIGLAPISVKSKPIILNKKSQISVNFTSSLSTIFLNLVGHITLLPIEFWNLYNSLSTGVPEGWNAFEHCIHNFFGISVILIQLAFISIFSFRHEKIVGILNKLLSFKSKLVKSQSDLNECSGQFHQLVIFTGYLLVLIILYFGRLTSVGEGDKIGMIIAVLSKFIVRNLMIQYSIILVLIEKKYFSLNESLLLFSNHDDQLWCLNSDLDSVEEENSTDYEELIFLREAYFDLNEIADDITQFYSIPMVISLGYFCISTIFTGHGMIKSMIGYIKNERTSSLRLCIGYVFLFVLCIYPTICVTSCVTSVLKEVR